MPKGEKDFARVAHSVFRQSIGEEPRAEVPNEKNAAAVSLGSSGGKARASKLTKEQRSEIAKKAAAVRWQK